MLYKEIYAHQMTSSWSCKTKNGFMAKASSLVCIGKSAIA